MSIDSVIVIHNVARMTSPDTKSRLSREERLQVQLTARFQAGPDSYNVLAEIPGSDPKLRDEVVFLGAHLDSWHTATGATDNADGVVAVMEAMRILMTLDAKPRRTIRAMPAAST